MARPRLLLIFPPQAPATFPHLALPMLTASARQAGIDAVQADLNAVFYRTVLSSSVISDTLGRLDRSGEGGMAGMRRAALLASLGGAGGKAVDGAVAVLSGADPGAFYDLSRYAVAIHDLLTASRVVGARYGAEEIGLFRSVLRYSERSSAEISLALTDSDHNPYLDLLAKLLERLIEDVDPQYVGLSVTYTAQMIPAFTLARLVRELRPRAKLIFGGNTITHLAASLAVSPLSRYADAFVLGEGEEALPSLVLAMESGEDPSGIRGVMLPGGKGGPATPARVEDLDTLPVPCFDGLDFTAYLAPKPIVPIGPSRGCYWGKCAFCNYNAVYGYGYRTLSPGRLAEVMGALGKTLGARVFLLTDSVVSPALLSGLAGALRSAALDVVWDATVRAEPELTEGSLLDEAYQSGLRLLHFGLESASPRVLTLMRKGTRVETAGRLIEEAHRAGIWSQALFFFGFPGETEEEAKETIAFVDRYRDKLELAVPGVEFTMTPNSPVMQEPGRFGVESIDRVPGHDLALVFAHENARGLRRARVVELSAEYTKWLKAQAISRETSLIYPLLGGHDLLYAARYRVGEVLWLKTGAAGGRMAVGA